VVDALAAPRSGVDDLIDRNRRLLARAEAARVWKRQVVEEIAETRLMLHVTLLRTMQLHFGRTGVPVGDELSASVARPCNSHSPRHARPRRLRCHQRAPGAIGLPVPATRPPVPLLTALPMWSADRRRVREERKARHRVNGGPESVFGSSGVVGIDTTRHQTDASCSQEFPRWDHARRGFRPAVASRVQ